MASDPGDDLAVLRSKRDATRYQILVEIAARQPAVSQREIADAIGVTAQAVSENLKELDGAGLVSKEGRGRYSVTKEGVDWLLSRTEELRGLVEYVSEEVVGEVEVEAAVAAADLSAGETVSLAMADGVLHARPDDGGAATARTLDAAAEGEAVGVTDFAGILEFEQGTVTAVGVPPVGDGAGDVDADDLADRAGGADLVAAAGTEALVAARAADLDPVVRFAVGPAVREAAEKGLDVLLVATATELPRLASDLREAGIEVTVGGE